MTLSRRLLPAVTILALFALVAALGATLPTARAADHLDAPGLMNPGGDPRLDINDLYVFEGADADNTVLAVTVNPVATGDSKFIENRRGAYHLRIDQNGDAIEDVTYSIRFIDRRFRAGGSAQWALVTRAEGNLATATSPYGSVVAFGPTDSTIGVRTGGSAFAGLRSDPFFFDLTGFLGTVEGIGDDALGEEPSDFFTDLNTLAIVIEVPDEALGEEIAVWATTSGRDRFRWQQIDRMGRPAINTVVNSSGPLVQAPSAAKSVFNSGIPRNDQADFTEAVISALTVFSSLDDEGSYSPAEAAALAGVLLPDVLRYDTSTNAAGPLNGRALADDVIDIELRIVTGGDPLGLFDDRDADGGVNGDGVGPHTDYLSTFPYLGVPNA